MIFFLVSSIDSLLSVTILFLVFLAIPILSVMLLYAFELSRIVSYAENATDFPTFPIQLLLNDAIELLSELMSLYVLFDLSLLKNKCYPHRLPGICSPYIGLFVMLKLWYLYKKKITAPKLDTVI